MTVPSRLALRVRVAAAAVDSEIGELQDVLGSASGSLARVSGNGSYPAGIASAADTAASIRGDRVPRVFHSGLPGMSLGRRPPAVAVSEKILARAGRKTCCRVFRVRSGLLGQVYYSAEV